MSGNWSSSCFTPKRTAETTLHAASTKRIVCSNFPTPACHTAVELGRGPGKHGWQVSDRPPRYPL